MTHYTIAALRAAMSEQGISDAGLDIRYEEEHVGYPGGSYINRNIVVSGYGKTERYDAVMTARNPELTACEIRQVFTDPARESVRKAGEGMER